MSKRTKKFLKLAIAGALALSLSPLASKVVSADTRHPHPYYKDTWNFGVTSSGWAYSDYYLEAPVRLGSGSSVTDFWGNIKSSARANYGWARSCAQKRNGGVQAKSFYHWYEF